MTYATEKSGNLCKVELLKFHVTSSVTLVDYLRAPRQYSLDTQGPTTWKTNLVPCF